MGKPALSYIAEKRYEQGLGRSIGSDAFSYPTSWGLLVESYVNDNYLGAEYVLASKDVVSHPTIARWKGSPDLILKDTISDIKCPYTLLSFCPMIESLSKGIEAFKTDYKEYYWQLISNAIICDKPNIELVVFAPYQSELMAIREHASNYDGDDPFQFKWVVDCQDKKLPYLIEGKKYTNINKFRFPIPTGEKEFLTEKVETAILEL